MTTVRKTATGNNSKDGDKLTGYEKAMYIQKKKVDVLSRKVDRHKSNMEKRQFKIKVEPK